MASLAERRRVADLKFLAGLLNDNIDSPVLLSQISIKVPSRPSKALFYVLEEISDENLSNWVYETLDEVKGYIEELATLANKMYAFSSTTKNIHRELKKWCAELKQKTEEAIKGRKICHPYVERASDRIDDLSSSIREMSVLQIQPNTSFKATATEPESVRTDQKSGYPTTGHIVNSEKSFPRSRTSEAQPVREGRRKKSKMKDETACSRREKIKTRSETIIVRPSGTSTYADMAKKLKESIDVDTINVSVRSMKRSRKGELILQLEKSPMQEEAAGRLKDAAAKALGSEAVVEHSPNTTLVEIRDLDSITTEEEVLRAVANITCTPRVLRLVPTYGGNMMATVKMRSRDITTLLSAVRLVIGLVRCPCEWTNHYVIVYQ